MAQHRAPRRPSEHPRPPVDRFALDQVTVRRHPTLALLLADPRDPQALAAAGIEAARYQLVAGRSRALVASIDTLLAEADR